MPRSESKAPVDWKGWLMLAWAGPILVLYLMMYVAAKGPQVLAIAQEVASRRWPPLW